MSDYESHKGRIKPIFRLENESDKQYFFRATGKDISTEDFDDLMEAIYDLDLYNKYFYVRETIYENLEHEELDPYSSECVLNGNDTDGYTYHTMFYNGGTCLSEIIEEAIEKLK